MWKAWGMQVCGETQAGPGRGSKGVLAPTPSGLCPTAPAEAKQCAWLLCVLGAALGHSSQEGQQGGSGQLTSQLPARKLQSLHLPLLPTVPLGAETLALVLGGGGGPRGASTAYHPTPCGLNTYMCNPEEVQDQSAALLSATQHTVTMCMATGCVSVSQNACGRDHARDAQAASHGPCPHPGTGCTMNSPHPTHSWGSPPSVPRALHLLPGVWWAQGDQSTDPGLPSHTSSQGSFGPMGPASTKWLWPEGQACRVKLAGSWGPRVPPTHLSSGAPRNAGLGPGSTHGQRRHRLTGRARPPAPQYRGAWEWRSESRW